MDYEVRIALHCSNRKKKSAADLGFTKGGDNLKGGANLLFGQISPKTAWKWRNLDGEGARFQNFRVRSHLATTTGIFDVVSIFFISSEMVSIVTNVTLGTERQKNTSLSSSANGPLLCRSATGNVYLHFNLEFCFPSIKIEIWLNVNPHASTVENNFNLARWYFTKQVMSSPKSKPLVCLVHRNLSNWKGSNRTF